MEWMAKRRLGRREGCNEERKISVKVMEEKRRDRKDEEKKNSER